MKILIVYNTMEYVWYRRFFLRDLLAGGHEVVAVAPFDDWTDRVRSLGIKCVDLRLTRWGTNPASEVAAIRDIYSVMRRESPDVAILYTIKPVIYGSLAARAAGVRRIFSLVTGLGYMFVEGGRFTKVKQWAARNLYRLALAQNERVFFQNPDDLALFTSGGVIDEAKTILVPGSGVDTEHFSPDTAPPDDDHFLLVSRMMWDKGVGEFVEAARRLKKRYPHAKFTLLGPLDDNPKAIPEDKLREWDAEGAVRYLGPADDIRPYLARCSVYVLPSRYREGIPRTNLEALAMGKPIITTDMPGCRETVVPLRNGFMITPGDTDALVTAMDAFLMDRALAGRMGAESRKLALEKFRVEAVNRSFLEAIAAGTSRRGDRLKQRPQEL